MTREAAMAAVCPDGVVTHIGLLHSDGGIDVRRLALQEISLIGTYTDTVVDLGVAVKKLYVGAYGNLAGSISVAWGTKTGLSPICCMDVAQH